MTWIFPATPESRIDAATDSAFGISRAARVMFAPTLARARAVSAPRPPEAPVIRTVFPVRSAPWMTSLLVESLSKGGGMGDIRFSAAGGVEPIPLRSPKGRAGS